LIVLQVLAVLLPRFKRSIVAVIWFFLRSRLEIIIMLGNAIRFVTLLLFVGFFPSFYAFTFCVDCFADFAGLIPRFKRLIVAVNWFFLCSGL
jgi:hypothetical protein